MESNAKTGHIAIEEHILENCDYISEEIALHKDSATIEVERGAERMKYTLTDSPPWYACLLLGLQHFLTMFFVQVAMATAFAVVVCLGADLPTRSHILSSILFVAGLATILQTLFGCRLPIVQGSSVAFVTPMLATMSLPQWRCSEETGVYQIVDENITLSSEYASSRVSSVNITNYTEIAGKGSVSDFARIREIQGALIVAGIFEMLLGTTGILAVFLRVLSPMVITAVITMLGVSLIPVATQLSSTCWPIAALAFVLVVLFSQVLSKVEVPLPGYSQHKKCHVTRYPIFMVLSILLSVLITWFVCYILTVSGAFGNNPSAFGYSSSTDLKASVIRDSPWVRVPYPLQWGIPTFSAAPAVGMMSAVLATVMESIGDYYTCARLAQGPAPPAHAINRGIAMEGFALLLNGLVGTGQGSTSYSINIAVISITKVSSRKVVVYAGFWMMFLGILSKFSAVFTAMPDPIVGGLYYIYVGYLISAGLSNLQFVNLHSSRNMCVLGVALGLGLAIPQWIKAHPSAVRTGSVTADQILTVLLRTEMLMAGLLAMLLDNILPGTNVDRGIVRWRSTVSTPDGVPAMKSSRIYNFPFSHRCKQRKWMTYVPIFPSYAGCNR